MNMCFQLLTSYVGWDVTKKRPEFINLGSHVKSKKFAELGKAANRLR